MKSLSRYWARDRVIHEMFLGVDREIGWSSHRGSLATDLHWQNFPPLLLHLGQPYVFLFFVIVATGDSHSWISPHWHPVHCSHTCLVVPEVKSFGSLFPFLVGCHNFACFAKSGWSKNLLPWELPAIPAHNWAALTELNEVLQDSCVWEHFIMEPWIAESVMQTADV